jgi:hypothetical protein
MVTYGVPDILNSSFDATNTALKVVSVNIEGTGFSALSAAATANVKTIAAVAAQQHHLCQLTVCVSDSAVTGPVTVTVADPGVSP